MSRLAEIEGHLASMGELLDVVAAMRALAGMRMQEAQATLPGIRRYAQALVDGIADTLLLLEAPAPPRPGPTGLVLCSAEHGFVGGFNERLVEAAEAALGPGDRLYALGTRGAVLAEERGRRPHWSHPMASRCAAAPETVQQVTAALYRDIAEARISRVEVLFARNGQAGGIERRQLLPLDSEGLQARQSSQPPLHTLPPGALYRRLLAEYVFALLTEAAVESIASENQARLEAMRSAHDNVSKKLEDLQRDARQARQDEITDELSDIVTGTRALAGR